METDLPADFTSLSSPLPHDFLVTASASAFCLFELLKYVLILTNSLSSCMYTYLLCILNYSEAVSQFLRTPTMKIPQNLCVLISSLFYVLVTRICFSYFSLVGNQGITLNLLTGILLSHSLSLSPSPSRPFYLCIYPPTGCNFFGKLLIRALV